MWWSSVMSALLLATALNGLPLDVNPEAEVVPASSLDNATLATDLQPPPIDASIAGKRHGVVYLINVYAVMNATDLEDGEEKLTDEIVESMPGILEPVATVLLVVEADDEDDPVNLDSIATDLQDEGFPIEKVTKNGETKVIKVDFGDDADYETKDNSIDEQPIKPTTVATNKVRRKRAPCLKCKLGNLLGGGGGGYGGGYGGGGYGGGGYGGGGYGGGGYPGGGGHHGGGGSIGVVPIVVVPVNGYPSGGHGGGGGHHHHHGGGGGGYPSHGGYPSGGGGYPSGGGGQCNVCGGQGYNGGGGHGGGGGSWSQSSAQASAQSSSGNW